MPLCGNAYKISVTGLAFCVIWHDKHSGDWLAALTTKGENAGMVHEVYDSPVFPLHTSRFPLSWQGNWIHRREKRPANPVTRFPVGETPRRGKGCTRQSADLASHRYPDRQSAACVIFVSYSWTRLRREGSKGSEGKVLKMDRPYGPEGS